jgi:beta-phosphoglucomutase-like phosphatase (HAD superfamily)
VTVRKAVLWDMDGTLVDSEPIAVEALRRAMAEQGIVPPDDLHDLVVGRPADELYRWYARDLGLNLDPVSWERRKHRHHLAALGTLRGFAPAIALFKALDARGLPQAIVSNSDRIIMDAQLHAVGIARPGLVTVSRNDVRHGKPEPEGYLRAAWLLDVPPGDCIVVEDSPSGATAGLAACMRTVLVPHATMAPPHGVSQLETIDEIVAMVTG